MMACGDMSDTTQGKRILGRWPTSQVRMNKAYGVAATLVKILVQPAVSLARRGYKFPVILSDDR